MSRSPRTGRVWRPLGFARGRFWAFWVGGIRVSGFFFPGTGKCKAEATIGTAVSLTMKAPSLLVFLCVLTTWLQVATIYMVRPFVLCMEARGRAEQHFEDFAPCRTCLRGRERLGLGQHLLAGLQPGAGLLLVAPGNGLGRPRLRGFGRGRKAPNLRCGVKQHHPP